MFDSYLDEFMPSVEMREHLKHSDKDVSNIAEIIYYSPYPIDKKYKSLCTLREEIARNENDEFLQRECQDFIKAIELAEELKSAEGVFICESNTYNEEERCCESVYESVHATFDHLMEYIREDLGINKVTSRQLWWYEASKWITGSDGKLVEACTYIIVRGEVWFLYINSLLYQEFSNTNRFDDLNLSVPFKAGDIVETNGYPFTPQKRILIVSVGDNIDCCCLQSLYSNEEGKWNISAVKHGWYGFEQFYKLSALYTMKKYHGSLGEDEVLLNAVSMFIAGDEERGEAVVDKFIDNIDCTTDEVYQLVFGNIDESC